MNPHSPLGYYSPSGVYIDILTVSHGKGGGCCPKLENCVLNARARLLKRPTGSWFTTGSSKKALMGQSMRGLRVA